MNATAPTANPAWIRAAVVIGVGTVYAAAITANAPAATTIVARAPTVRRPGRPLRGPSLRSTLAAIPSTPAAPPA
ncbi:hypothetical protein [Streptomyces umbrinus]|uniref:hypothetical protein n=1 Tax=Streptomyces umbrinus TaxID=67370 RepID=UPI0033D7227A